MGSKFIVPLSLLEIGSTPALPLADWQKLYFKNGYLKHLKTSEKDLVLDRPLDNYMAQIVCSAITASDNVLTAFEKLQCQITTLGAHSSPASQAEVNAGVINAKFVSPLTLSESVYVKNFEWVIDFLDNQTLNTYSGYKPFVISTIDMIEGVATVSISVNATPYVLGSTINTSDKFDIVVSAASVIKLNCEEL